VARTTKDTENTKSLDMSGFLFVPFVIFVVPNYYCADTVLYGSGL